MFHPKVYSPHWSLTAKQKSKYKCHWAWCTPKCHTKRRSLTHVKLHATTVVAIHCVAPRIPASGITNAARVADVSALGPWRLRCLQFLNVDVLWVLELPSIFYLKKSLRIQSKFYRSAEQPTKDNDILTWLKGLPLYFALLWLWVTEPGIKTGVSNAELQSREWWILRCSLLEASWMMRWTGTPTQRRNNLKESSDTDSWENLNIPDEIFFHQERVISMFTKFWTQISGMKFPSPSVSIFEYESHQKSRNVTQNQELTSALTRLVKTQYYSIESQIPTLARGNRWRGFQQNCVYLPPVLFQFFETMFGLKNTLIFI